MATLFLRRVGFRWFDPIYRKSSPVQLLSGVYDVVHDKLVSNTSLFNNLLIEHDKFRSGEIVRRILTTFRPIIKMLFLSGGQG